MSEAPEETSLSRDVSFYLDIPLIDEEISDQIFGAEELLDDDEMAEIRGDLWQGICHDLPIDLAQVIDLLSREEDLVRGRKEAHRVAGYCGNSGMQRMGVLLRDLQHERAQPEMVRYLLEWGQNSLAALQARYPDLSR